MGVNHLGFALCMCGGGEQNKNLGEKFIYVKSAVNVQYLFIYLMYVLKNE